MASPLIHPNVLPTHDRLLFTLDVSIEEQVAQIAQRFLVKLELACVQNDPIGFSNLMLKEGIWRDILSFTGDYRSIAAKDIPTAAAAVLPRTQAHSFTYTSTPPQLLSPLPDLTFIEIHFTFKTNVGPAFGIAKIVKDGRLHEGNDQVEDDWQAYTLFTLLDGIEGFPERIRGNRPRGVHNSHQSWSDERKESSDWRGDHQPSVLIVGAGHNGLSVAARLKALGVHALVIDRQKRIGDNWRNRYQSLSLHDPIWCNHLAYLPFPETWPVFTPSGKLANWLETYADVLELNVWTEAELLHQETSFDEEKKQWSVTVSRKSKEDEQTLQTRQFKVDHIVLATGFGGGKAKMPDKVSGQDSFGGVIVHSSGHGSGASWTGQKALVVGACTSGHDIAFDLQNCGVETTMLQRSPTYVFSVKNALPMMQGSILSDLTRMGELFSDTSKIDIDLADRIVESTPKKLVKLFHQRYVPKLAELDKDLLDGLKNAGFQTYLGPDGSGLSELLLKKGGGYYFDTGCSSKIVDGTIKIKSGQIASFKGNGSKAVVFQDGSTDDYDLIVYATGYSGFEDRVRETVGEKYVSQMKPVWGVDEEGELRSVYRDSGIERLYIMVGNLSLSRLHSKSIALQIKAEQLGLLSPEKRYTIEKMRSEQAAA